MGTRKGCAVGMLAVAALCTACASGGAASRQTIALAPVISRAELRTAGGGTLFEVVRKVRPAFLAYRGATSINTPPSAAVLVVVDGIPLGDADVLRTIQASDVFQVRRLTAVETYQKYGRSVSIGGLEVVLDHR